MPITTTPYCGLKRFAPFLVWTREQDRGGLWYDRVQANASTVYEVVPLGFSGWAAVVRCPELPARHFCARREYADVLDAIISSESKCIAAAAAWDLPQTAEHLHWGPDGVCAGCLD